MLESGRVMHWLRHVASEVGIGLAARMLVHGSIGYVQKCGKEGEGKCSFFKTTGGSSFCSMDDACDSRWPSN